MLQKPQSDWLSIRDAYQLCCVVIWQLHDNTLLFGPCYSVVLEDVWSTRKLVWYSVFDFKTGVFSCFF